MGSKEDYEQFAEWNACGRKVTYHTRNAAKKAVRLLNRKFKSNKKVYRCRYCKLFHVGEWHTETKDSGTEKPD